MSFIEPCAGAAVTLEPRRGASNWFFALATDEDGGIGGVFEKCIALFY